LLGLRAIQNLCAGNAGNRERLGSSGACGLCVRALLKHREDPTLQLAGCGAVRNLAAHSPDNKRRLRDCGACVAVAATLHTFGCPPSDSCSPADRRSCSSAVVLAALLACVNLAGDERNRRGLGQAGACEAVARILSRCASSVLSSRRKSGEQPSSRGASERDLCLAASGAMRNLAFQSPENLAKLRAAGGRRAGAAALRAFPSDLAIRREVARAGV